jgi:hypothetical protein
MIRDMAEEDGLPDYSLSFAAGPGAGDVLVVRSRDRLGEGPRPGDPQLPPGAHARAREAAPGYDPYWLEAEWLRLWRGSGRPALRSPEAAFLAFCRARAARAPRP